MRSPALLTRITRHRDAGDKVVRRALHYQMPLGALGSISRIWMDLSARWRQVGSPAILTRTTRQRGAGNRVDLSAAASARAPSPQTSPATPTRTTRRRDAGRVELPRQAGADTRRPASLFLSPPTRRPRSLVSLSAIAQPSGYCVPAEEVGPGTRVCHPSTRAPSTGSPHCRLHPWLMPARRCGALRMRRLPLSLILWSPVNARARKRSVARQHLGPHSKAPRIVPP